jgi:PKD repeat protein
MKHLGTLTFTLFFVVLSLGVDAQVDPMVQPSVDRVFGTKTEIAFKFYVDNKDIINNDLTRIISIDKVTPSPKGGYDVRAYANRKEFSAFLTREIEYQLVVPSQVKAYDMATTVAQMATWDRYPTYSVYEQMLAQFASSYPSLCNIDTILSATPDGHRLLVARISDNVNTAENEPRFLYSSSMHGDETTGYYLMLRLIDYLLSNYGSISKVTNLVNGVEIWICPLANPDGTYASGDNTISAISSTRYNANYVDLNRNYPDPIDGLHPDGEAWQPETQAFMTFAANEHINMSANFHGGAEVMNYPWDTWTSSGNPNADDTWWNRVCQAYVDTARLIDANFMTDVVSSGVTEGGDWYQITGGRQDYMNYFQQCREVCIELDGTKTTETQNLPGEWNKNYRSLLNFIQESTYGIRGIISDSCSGQPIHAKVWVTGYDQANDSSQVYSYLPIGDYHKYIIAGTYSVTFSAPGYASKTINNVTVSNGNATTLNVALAPTLPAANFSTDVTTTCSGIVNFSDLSTGGPTTWNWNFGDGFGSSAQNPVHVYTVDGNYTVSLTVGNCKGTNTMTLTSLVAVTLASPPTVTHDTSCGPGTLVLGASGTGTLSWYDAPSGGNLVGTGSSFTTPYLSSSTTYYVQNEMPSTPVFGGKLDNSGAGGYYTSTGVHGLYFDCYEACTLVSVNVYSNNAGNKTIEIPALSYSGSFPVLSGMNNIVLNWAIPVGSNYLIRGSAVNNLYRNGTSNGPNLGYPFNIGTMISITQSTAGAPNEDAYYYFFYNWEVSPEACASAAVAVTATIDQLPVAGFSYTSVGLTATFTNTSTYGGTYLWDFGDGQTSTDQNPAHTYAADGTYSVTLIVTNSCDDDTITLPVTVMAVGGIEDGSDAGEIRIFPNPASNTVFLSYKTNGSQNCEAEFLNIVGTRMKIVQLPFDAGHETLAVDVHEFEQGIYFIRMTIEGNTVTRKIIIDN